MISSGRLQIALNLLLRSTKNREEFGFLVWFSVKIRFEKFFALICRLDLCYSPGYTYEVIDLNIPIQGK